MMTSEEKKDLVQAALQARKWAYAPYSEYPVGAALMAASGRVYEGVNVENAAYPTSICAERSAVFHAVSQGEREFNAIAVVTENGGSPCGACRQVLSEFGLDILVLIADDTGKLLDEIAVRDLLPESFGPLDLLKESP
jgi:cytidine deaminase